MDEIKNTTSFDQLVRRNLEYRDESGELRREPYPNPASFAYAPSPPPVHEQAAASI